MFLGSDTEIILNSVKISGMPNVVITIEIEGIACGNLGKGRITLEFPVTDLKAEKGKITIETEL